MDLYGPPDKKEVKKVETTLEIDMNESNLTLFQVIQRTSKFLNQFDSEKQLSIYFVSGFKQNNVYDFWNEYYLYLKNIPNPERLTIIFRGYLHLWNLGIFFLDIPVIVNKDCKIIYDKSKLHDILEGLSDNIEIYQKFSRRFLDYYKNMNYIVINDLSELQKLGIEFQTF